MNIPWILPVLFLSAALIQTGKPCMVDVTPKLVFTSVNTIITLNCTFGCEHASWESRLLKKNTSRNGNMSSVDLEVDDYNDSEIQCLTYSDDMPNYIFTSKSKVIVYALPSRVEIDVKKEMEEGKEYEAMCHIYDVAPVKLVTISLTRGGEIFLSHTYDGDNRNGTQSLSQTFTIKADRHHLEFGCLVTMNLTDVDNTTVQSPPVTTSVFYPPAFTSCPESIVWVEGQNKEFVCEAEGNPTPFVQCNFNFTTYQFPNTFSAERTMSGVYECEASNSLKNITRPVNVIVEYEPGTPKVMFSANSTISKGASFNLSCYSNAMPPARYHWKIPPRAKVIYSSDNSTIFIENASSDYNGTYTCEVSNRHGQSKAEQHVEVEKDDILWIIILAIVLIILVIIIVLITLCLLKKDKKGFYDLLKWNRGPTHTALPLEDNNTA